MPLLAHRVVHTPFLSFTQKHGRKVGRQLLAFLQVQHVFLNWSGQHPTNSKLDPPTADRRRRNKKQNAL